MATKNIRRIPAELKTLLKEKSEYFTASQKQFIEGCLVFQQKYPQLSTRQMKVVDSILRSIKYRIENDLTYE